MSPIRMSKVESSIRVVLQFHEAFNQHDVARMMDLISDDCLFEDTEPIPDGTVYSGKEAITQYWQDFFHKSAQARIEIEEVFGFGERCIMRWKYSWREIEGNEGHIRGVDVFRVRGGFIREKFSYVKG